MNSSHQTGRAQLGDFQVSPVAAEIPSGFGGQAGSPMPQHSASADYRKMYERTSTLAKIGVWECDLLDERLTWTDAVYDLFELSRGAPLSRADVLAFYGEQSRLELERRRGKAIAEGGSFDMDILIRTARGQDRWLHLTVDVEQHEGKSVRIFGTKQDITERKVAQEKLRLLQAELLHVSGRRAMGTMAETLAHELNQPLAAIANYAAGVRRLVAAGDAPAGVADGLEQIDENALRAGEIIRRMRLMANRGRALAEEFALEGPVRAAAGLGAAGHAEVGLSFAFGHSGTVLADSVQVEQVIINLVKNACEAMESSQPREVAIATRDEGEYVVVEVADSGPGMPADSDDFEVRASTKANGMGIGLSVCRTIVEANGGRIWSEPAKVGARLYFTIPKSCRA